LNGDFSNGIKSQRAIQDAAIPGETPTSLEAFQGVLNDITKKGGELEPLVKLVRPKLPDSLKAQFDRIMEDAATVKGKPAVTESTGLVDASGNPILKVVEPEIPAKPLTWDDTKQLLTALGDARGDFKVVNEIGRDNVNRIYAALQGDRGRAAESLGVRDIFDSTNAEMNRLYQLAEGPASKVVAGKVKTSDDPSPDKIVDSLDATNLAGLREIAPQGVGQITAHRLRGGKDWMAMEPEEQIALVPNPDHRVSLDYAHSVKANIPDDLKVAKTTEKELGKEELADVRMVAKRIQNEQKDALDAAKEEAARLKAVAPGTSPARQEHKDLITFLAAEKLVPRLLMQMNVPEQMAEAIGGPLGLAVTHALRGVKNSPYGALPGMVGGEANPLLPDIAFTAPGRTSR